MRRRLSVPPLPALAIVLTGLLVFHGCAPKQATKPPAAGETKAEAPTAAPGKVGMPSEVEIPLTLSPGQSWKSRFVSTGEIRQTYTGGDGKTATRTKATGLELVATQLVKEVNGSVARIEVNELSTKILQDGKFVDAPFRQFNIPTPFTFTIDTGTGKTDFSAMEKAYADWMAGIKEGPAGEIMGRTFRLDSYVSQLKELYGKPFNRFVRKKISKELKTTGEKEFSLPYVGPGVAMGPVQVEMLLRFEGMEVKGGQHFLKVSGEYTGRGVMSQEELDARLGDFGAAGPKATQTSRDARGEFRSTVDVLSGREIQATSRVTYTAMALAGGSYQEEVVAKLLLEPVE